MNQKISFMRPIVSVSLALALVSACHATPAPSSSEAAAPPAPVSTTSPPATATGQSPSTVAVPAANAAVSALAFRDAVSGPPPGWKGPVFKLSRSYPRARPTCDAPWLKRPVSFTDRKQVWSAAWAGYIQDVVNYVREGQEADLPDEVGFRTDVLGQTRWFHVPWMAYDGQRGREFVHGLTNELSTAVSTFKGIGRGTGFPVFVFIPEERFARRLCACENLDR